VAFRGTFEHTLDAKNRLTIPAKFRAALAEGVVLSMRVDGKRCVAIWRPADYERYTDEMLAGFRRGSPKAENLKRILFGKSYDTELDGAGRVMVPNFLLDHAGLAKDAVITSAGDCLEVWDRAAWSDYDETLFAEVSEITAQLDDPA
jgi:MraZ protein